MIGFKSFHFFVVAFMLLASGARAQSPAPLVTLVGDINADIIACNDPSMGGEIFSALETLLENTGNSTVGDPVCAFLLTEDMSALPEDISALLSRLERAMRGLGTSDVAVGPFEGIAGPLYWGYGGAFVLENKTYMVLIMDIPATGVVAIRASQVYSGN